MHGSDFFQRPSWWFGVVGGFGLVKEGVSQFRRSISLPSTWWFGAVVWIAFEVRGFPFTQTSEKSFPVSLLPSGTSIGSITKLVVWFAFCQKPGIALLPVGRSRMAFFSFPVLGGLDDLVIREGLPFYPLKNQRLKSESKRPTQATN